MTTKKQDTSKKTTTEKTGEQTTIDGVGTPNPDPTQVEPPTPAVDRPGPVDTPAQPAQGTPGQHSTAD